MQVNELFRQSNTILLDGGMGTMLQAAGLKLGARPEELNITDPALIGAWMMSFSRLLRRAARNETATAVATHSKYSFDPS